MARRNLCGRVRMRRISGTYVMGPGIGGLRCQRRILAWVVLQQWLTMGRTKEGQKAKTCNNDEHGCIAIHVKIQMSLFFVLNYSFWGHDITLSLGNRLVGMT